MTTVRETFGLACPECGSDKDITVEVTTWVRLYEDGTEQVGDQEWAIDSPCSCGECGSVGTVTTFTVPDAKEDQRGGGPQ